MFTKHSQPVGLSWFILGINDLLPFSMFLGAKSIYIDFFDINELFSNSFRPKSWEMLIFGDTSLFFRAL